VKLHPALQVRLSREMDGAQNVPIRLRPGSIGVLIMAVPAQIHSENFAS